MRSSLGVSNGCDSPLVFSSNELTSRLDDETNLEELEANVRAIEKDGLVWGASKWIPLAYAIKKLQINLVVEDEKISLDELQQEIEEDEDHVQSTDVAAMQKL